MEYLLSFFLLAIGKAFAHEQALHAKNFRGESQAFCTMLWISVYASWITSIAVLVYIVLNLSWVAALAMFVGGVLVSGVIAGLISSIVDRAIGQIGQLYISFAAFIIWPACFLAAYLSLPTVM